MCLCVCVCSGRGRGVFVLHAPASEFVIENCIVFKCGIPPINVIWVI